MLEGIERQNREGKVKIRGFFLKKGVKLEKVKRRSRIGLGDGEEGQKEAKKEEMEENRQLRI